MKRHPDLKAGKQEPPGLAGTVAGRRRSAGFQPAMRRPVGGAGCFPHLATKAALPSGTRRYGRLKICATTPASAPHDTALRP